MIHPIFAVSVLTSFFCSTVIYAQETKCSLNESMQPCGNRCEKRCNAPSLPKFCNGNICEDMGCRCSDGFMRNPESNECVPKWGCPENDCTTGEIKGACGMQCEGTCNSREEPKICQTISCSNSSCRCDLAGGFVRNKLGICVLKEEC